MTDKQSNCAHENFNASVRVNRVERNPGQVAGFSADIAINCVQCGAPFAFLGIGRIGLSFEQPTTNLDATELRQPIAPSLDWVNGDPLPGFILSHRT